MKQLIKDVLTGEEIITDFTPEELAQREIDAANAATAKAEAETKQAAKAALLSKLGITAEEAQLLLGGN